MPRYRRPNESTAQYCEDAEIDFLFFGSYADYLKSVERPLQRALGKGRKVVRIVEGIGRLNGRLSCLGASGEELTLAGHPLHHGNMIIRLEYSAGAQVQPFVREELLPELIERYVSPHLKSRRCTLLRDLHTIEYIRGTRTGWAGRIST